MALEIVIKSEDKNPVLELTGKIVDVDVKKFQHKMDSLYKNKELSRIVVDVTGADFIDSHGLGVIVYFHTLLQKEKRTLTIVNANPDQNSYLNRLFEVTNLDKVLNITNSAD
ncbi:MAG: STAS domain-containing protein [Chitinispirillia bacterium]|nr:STAS domain-containing protein [Chitinispirillia bacterium]MCL2241656.1 STAS domain-containing protein [Chitinispirillia bacterium]